MQLKFTKMHGLGNDFMVIDGTKQPITLTPEQIRLLGNRHFGIGFDQLLLVEMPHHPGNDFRYRIFNNDGGEVEQCGNGARCFARFVYEQELTNKQKIRVETAKGVIVPEYQHDGQAKVNMGIPRFEPAAIPFDADAEAICHLLELGDDQVEISVVSMGNPHAVQVVTDIHQAPVLTQGAAIEQHPRFPQRVNAGFMQIISRQEIQLRVFERAAGETLACGTGACAAVVAGIRRGLLDNSVVVHTRGGDLTISWLGAGEEVMMTGPAITVFQGEVSI
ncbi:diaminopimelate epimerase [Neisseriaceae bacterium TC5R-5]|nr:diaminopimelate epimerase [Neisseriaceae bacterium TC5R-5]